MGFSAVKEGVAASIYLALYCIYFLITIVIIRKVGWKTRFTFLFIFALFRVSGQLCGVVFSKLGVEYYNWLIAYLVLTAEGYFTLVLTCFHFIAKAQIEVSGKSWIRPTATEIEARNPRAGRLALTLHKHLTIASTFHWILIPANAIVITGGSMLSSISSDEWDQAQQKINTSKALRCTGQVIFLCQTLFIIGLTTYVFFKENVRIYTTKALFATFPFLLVRGIFGILSIFISRMNYFQLSNYDEHGLSAYFIACEYTMATTMEFIAACILLSIFFHDLRYGVKDSDRLYTSDVESESKELSVKE